MNRVSVVLVLLLFLAFLCAVAYQAYELNQVRLGKTKVVNEFLPQPQQNNDPLARIKTANLVDIAKANLMGDPNKQPAKPLAAAVKAVEPPMNMVLMGVIISSTENNSSAFIQINGQTKRYYLGQMIDGGAELTSINTDSVEFKRGDKVETLRYPAAAAMGSPQWAQLPNTPPAMVPPSVQVPATSGAQNPNVAPTDKQATDVRSRLWRLPPAVPGGSPRDRPRETK